jgi:peptidoglycan hydrolase CwlO-like protein
MKIFSKVSLVASLIITSTSFAATEVNAKLGQNLKIMQDILQSSLGGQEHSSIGRIQHSYLIGQGVAFRVDSNSGWLSHFVMPPMPPLPPGAPGAPAAPAAPGTVSAVQANAANAINISTDGGNFSFNFDEEAMEAMVESAEAWAEQVQDQNEKLRDLREERRDIERDLRDYEREKRDIEFSAKVSKLDAEQQKKLTEINQKSEQLKSQLAQLQKTLTTEETLYNKQKAEQDKLAKQRQTELVAKVGQVFSNTLCDYGASLRDLKEQEFVSFQLNLSGRDQAKDHYWVVKKTDINQCVTGKIDAPALLKKASYYQY